MDKPTKYLVVGIAIAMLTCVAGYLTSVYDNYKITSSVEKCKAEASDNKVVCDPDDLAALGVNKVLGVQKEIVVAQLNVGRTFNNTIILAAVVFALFATPYAWYFLLRRIRELRDAIAGR